MDEEAIKLSRENTNRKKPQNPSKKRNLAKLSSALKENLLRRKNVALSTNGYSIPKAVRDSNSDLSGERPECTEEYMRTRIHDKSEDEILKCEGYMGKENSKADEDIR